MLKRVYALSAVLVTVGFTVLAQSPTGTNLATVRDETGAAVPGAQITITDKATSAARSVRANAEGPYGAPSLPSGTYEVRVERSGFRTVVRDARVLAGTTTTIDVSLPLGVTRKIAKVEGAAAQINYDSPTVEGVIQSQNSQELPLNGRSFLQLATLEPGVITTPGSTGQFNTLFYISTPSGAGQNGPVLTVDGAVVNDEMDGGGTGVTRHSAFRMDVG